MFCDVTHYFVTFRELDFKHETTIFGLNIKIMHQQPIRDENGESIIPASQRPDGTWRKARRVKEGYVPQEEVPLYESKGRQVANLLATSAPAINAPVGYVAHQSIPGLFIVDDKKETKTKKKSKNVDDLTKQLKQTTINENATSNNKPSKLKAAITKQVSVKKQAVDKSEVDPSKRLKNLKKKLREIEMLEDKIESGQLAKPEPEQLTKIKRKNDLLLEIRLLEKTL